MLWLARPPILRWIGACILVAVAAWAEFAPSPYVEMPFLASDLPAGSPIGPSDVEMRRIPNIGLTPASTGGFAAAGLAAGDPLVASMSVDFVVPEGWFVIDAPLPSGARPGSPGTGVILGTSPEHASRTFPILVVSTAPADTFEAGGGTAAVPGDWVAEAAAAASAGRLVIGIEAGR